ncbi:Vacuolar protein sorting-associated protein vps5 [Intoshia linei]|uniref:Vacuolar protein sorting-associated protein vps5 n=1 Tax=Intoshia linei TaxID=1819745 RepID=A0A177B0W7_9BILA|nr:Vacuolar protein sorting-associated protein vps5 [Intoshia linei]
MLNGDKDAFGEEICDPLAINTALDIKNENASDYDRFSNSLDKQDSQFDDIGKEIAGEVHRHDSNVSNFIEKMDTVIEIKSTHRIGEGMSSYINYVISTTTSNKKFQARTMTVERRYSEFFALRTRITELYVVQGYIIPSIPEKDILSMTKGKVTSADKDDIFVEKRRIALSIFLNACIRKDILKSEPLLIEFLEKPTLPKYPGASSLSTAGFMRFISSLTNSKTVGGVVQLMDEPFIKKIEMVEEIENSLKAVFYAIDAIMHKSQELHLITDHYAQCISNLANTESDKTLGLLCSKVACLEETQNAIINKSCYSNQFNFHCVISNVILNYDGIREVNHARVKSYKMWKDALLQRTKKMEILHKAEINGRADKVFAVKEEIREWQELEDKYNNRYNLISTRFMSELQYIENLRIKDLSCAIKQYVYNKHKAQEKETQYWKKFLTDFETK